MAMIKKHSTGTQDRDHSRPSISDDEREALELLGIAGLIGYGYLATIWLFTKVIFKYVVLPLLAIIVPIVVLAGFVLYLAAKNG